MLSHCGAAGSRTSICVVLIYYTLKYFNPQRYPNRCLECSYNSGTKVPQCSANFAFSAKSVTRVTVGYVLSKFGFSVFSINHLHRMFKKDPCLG